MAARATPRILLIGAYPTPWDLEDRIVGSHPLPLAPEANQDIEGIIARLSFNVDRVYCSMANEACIETAKHVALRFNLRVRDQPELEEPNLGLWQGLTREELEFRYPSAFAQWLEEPLSIKPPDGEALEDAIVRIAEGLARVHSKTRGKTIALAQRPMAMQIVLGLSRGESPAEIASHLHARTPFATHGIEETA